MKFRKINEDKIQIILTTQDLEERDFRRWEMVPMSPKLQEFFHDLLERAYKECGFEISDESQLVVEAYPLNAETFAIILTRIPAGSMGEAHGVIQLGNLLERMEEDTNDENNTYIDPDRERKQVWIFDDLEQCINASCQLEPSYLEASALYKYEGQYYLTVDATKEGMLDVAAGLGEYGQWSYLPAPYFVEHGQLLIGENAVSNLASLDKPGR